VLGCNWPHLAVVKHVNKLTELLLLLLLLVVVVVVVVVVDPCYTAESDTYRRCDHVSQAGYVLFYRNYYKMCFNLFIRLCFHIRCC
jgi:hypothetical protein